MDRRGRDRAEQRHLQPPVFVELESFVFRKRLADREANLFAPVVHAAPYGRRPVACEVRRQVGRRRLQVRAIHQGGHRCDPGQYDENGDGTSNGAGQRPEQAHFSCVSVFRPARRRVRVPIRSSARAAPGRTFRTCWRSGRIVAAGFRPAARDAAWKRHDHAGHRGDRRPSAPRDSQTGG